ncbi:MAG: imidazolonepropionase [Parvularculaceae bacterium]
MQADRIWKNLRVWTGAQAGENPAGRAHWAIAVKNGSIVWTGPESSAPEAAETIDGENRLATPGLIDCHTHLVYAGDRADEWRMRLEGARYEEIAAAGGGIAATVDAVRAASEEALIAASAPRLRALKDEGVTTIEIKSGYGLDAENEAKMLRAARRLGETERVSVKTTFLGAHAIPESWIADDYIKNVCEDQLPAIAGEDLADAVDAYCEKIAFTPEQAAQVFRAAAAHGLPVKLHAEQLSNCNGAKMAAEMGALSCDHLEYLDEAGASAMAAAGSVAVLLPGAFYFLNETQKPPVDMLRAMNIPIAVATDCNPGTSPLASLQTAMNMACVLFGLTPGETFSGATRNAAAALGLQGEAGVIAPGAWCDLAFWDTPAIDSIIHNIGVNPLAERIWRGTSDGEWR